MMKALVRDQLRRSGPEPTAPPLDKVGNDTATVIGLQCESGDFNDCFQENEDTEYQSPIGCERMLIFTQSNRTCGINCDRNRNQRSKKMAIKEGWTFYLRFLTTKFMRSKTLIRSLIKMF